MEAFNAATEEQREKLWQLEDQLAGIYASTLRRAGKLAASRFKTVSKPQPVLAAGVPSPGWVPPDPEELVTREELRELSKKRLEHLWKRAVTLALLSYSGRFDVAFSVLNPFAAELLISIGSRDSMVWDAYRDEISRTIGESYEEGKSVPDAARAIRENVAGLKNSTAKMVARTDLNALSNGASIAAASALGNQAPQFKMWLSAGDDKVRPDHVEANRQVVPTSQPFKVGVEEMMFPGDPTASDSEVCNCRCTLIYTDEHGMVAAGWDESKHPRNERGTPMGGRWKKLQPGDRVVMTQTGQEGTVEKVNVPEPGQSQGLAYARVQWDKSGESSRVSNPGMNLAEAEAAKPSAGRFQSIADVEAANPDAMFEVTEDPEAIQLHSIFSLDPGQGAGSKALDELGEYADSKGVPIYLTPEQGDDMPGALTTPQLKAWYKRHGYEKSPTKMEDYAFTHSMVRRPKGMTAAAVDFSTGSMVALYPHPDQALMLEQPGGQPAEDLHITLCYLPNGWDGDKGAAMTSLVEIATVWGKLEGTVTGVSCFPEGEDGVPWIAVPNVRSLMDLREVVATVLEDAGMTISSDYEFTPHITLGYGVEPSRDVAGVPLTFTAISAVDGPERINIPLEPELTAAGWDESKHPRHEKGRSEGGKFRSAKETLANIHEVRDEETAKEQPATTDDVQMGIGWGSKRDQLAVKRNLPEPERKMIEDSLRGFVDSMPIGMRVPSTTLEEVLRDGEFYNQHQSGGTAGMGRSVSGEAEMFGLPSDTRPEDLPKYGYIGEDTETTLGYGDVRVVFKDEVKDRATFTVGDSLIEDDRLVPSPVRDPSYLSAPDEAVEYARATGFVEDDPYGERSTFGADIDWHEALQSGVPYFEAQIYGRLTPKDIERVEITDPSYWDQENNYDGMPLVRDPESMNRLGAELEKLGIPIDFVIPPGDYSGEWA